MLIRSTELFRLTEFGDRTFLMSFCHPKSATELAFSDDQTFYGRSKTKIRSIELFKTFFFVMSEPNSVVRKSPPGRPKNPNFQNMTCNPYSFLSNSDTTQTQPFHKELTHILLIWSISHYASKASIASTHHHSPSFPKRITLTCMHMHNPAI